MPLVTRSVGRMSTLSSCWNCIKFYHVILYHILLLHINQINSLEDQATSQLPSIRSTQVINLLMSNNHLPQNQSFAMESIQHRPMQQQPAVGLRQVLVPIMSNANQRQQQSPQSYIPLPRGTGSNNNNRFDVADKFGIRNNPLYLNRAFMMTNSSRIRGDRKSLSKHQQDQLPPPPHASFNLKRSDQLSEEQQQQQQTTWSQPDPRKSYSVPVGLIKFARKNSRLFSASADNNINQRDEKPLKSRDRLAWQTLHANRRRNFEDIIGRDDYGSTLSPPTSTMFGFSSSGSSDSDGDETNNNNSNDINSDWPSLSRANGEQTTPVPMETPGIATATTPPTASNTVGDRLAHSTSNLLPAERKHGGTGNLASEESGVFGRSSGMVNVIRYVPVIMSVPSDHLLPVSGGQVTSGGSAAAHNHGGGGQTNAQVLQTSPSSSSSSTLQQLTNGDDYEAPQGTHYGLLHLQKPDSLHQTSSSINSNLDNASASGNSLDVSSANWLGQLQPLGDYDSGFDYPAANSGSHFGFESGRGAHVPARIAAYLPISHPIALQANQLVSLMAQQQQQQQQQQQPMHTTGKALGAYASKLISMLRPSALLANIGVASHHSQQPQQVGIVGQQTGTHPQHAIYLLPITNEHLAQQTTGQKLQGSARYLGGLRTSDESLLNSASKNNLASSSSNAVGQSNQGYQQLQQTPLQSSLWSASNSKPLISLGGAPTNYNYWAHQKPDGHICLHANSGQQDMKAANSILMSSTTKGASQTSKGHQSWFPTQKYRAHSSSASPTLAPATKTSAPRPKTPTSSTTTTTTTTTSTSLRPTTTSVASNYNQSQMDDFELEQLTQQTTSGSGGHSDTQPTTTSTSTTTTSTTRAPNKPSKSSKRPASWTSGGKESPARLAQRLKGSQQVVRKIQQQQKIVIPDGETEQQQVGHPSSQSMYDEESPNGSQYSSQSNNLAAGNWDSESRQHRHYKLMSAPSENKSVVDNSATMMGKTNVISNSTNVEKAADISANKSIEDNYESQQQQSSSRKGIIPFTIKDKIDLPPRKVIQSNGRVQTSNSGSALVTIGYTSDSPVVYDEPVESEFGYTSGGHNIANNNNNNINTTTEWPARWFDDRRVKTTFVSAATRGQQSNGSGNYYNGNQQRRQPQSGLANHHRQRANNLGIDYRRDTGSGGVNHNNGGRWGSSGNQIPLLIATSSTRDLGASGERETPITEGDPTTSHLSAEQNEHPPFLRPSVVFARAPNNRASSFASLVPPPNTTPPSPSNFLVDSISASGSSPRTTSSTLTGVLVNPLTGSPVASASMTTTSTTTTMTTTAPPYTGELRGRLPRPSLKTWKADQQSRGTEAKQLSDLLAVSGRTSHPPSGSRINHISGKSRVNTDSKTESETVELVVNSTPEVVGSSTPAPFGQHQNTIGSRGDIYLNHKLEASPPTTAQLTTQPPDTQTTTSTTTTTNRAEILDGETTTPPTPTATDSPMVAQFAAGSRGPNEPSVPAGGSSDLMSSDRLVTSTDPTARPVNEQSTLNLNLNSMDIGYNSKHHSNGAEQTGASVNTNTNINTNLNSNHQSEFTDNLFSNDKSLSSLEEFGKVSEALQTNPLDLIDLQNSRSSFELPAQLESIDWHAGSSETGSAGQTTSETKSIDHLSPSMGLTNEQQTGPAAGSRGPPASNHRH